jgi:methylenetetrahydrofolate dehydrogenase (NADP+) / methenyltetrahydrofolate cyclohydrolase
MILLDGKKTAADILEEISVEVKERISLKKKVPHLAAVLVGEDPASQTYVAAKVKACEKVGFGSTLIKRDSSISEQELLQTISELNNDATIDGYIVQLPLPKQISERKIIEAILPEKDVDGFHPVNVGKMALNLPCFVSATPFGIIQLLKRYQITTEGKHCVVIGRSNIVGSPVSMLMARNAYPGNATVTLCHSKTTNLKEICLRADIIIAAIGKPDYVTADMVKEGAVVIDVGINRVADASTKSGFRLKGDVKFEEVSPKCSFITPVPGGVGPMTIASLLMNTLSAAKNKD